MNDENPIRVTVEELKELIDIKNFVGDSIEIEDKILIPFMKYGFGFGAGQGNDSKGDGGFGSGAGAGIEPTSLVVIDKKLEGMDGVRVLNLTKGTETSKAIAELGIVVTDLVKEIISNSNQNKEGQIEDSETSNNTQSDN